MDDLDQYLAGSQTEQLCNVAQYFWDGQVNQGADQVEFRLKTREEVR